MKVRLVGIPSNAGALYTGTEMTPKILREEGLLDQLIYQGIEILDLGDIVLPDDLPRHNIPPIRNWPAPQMVWEEIVRQSNSWFNEKELTIIIGGDCSIIVGTVQRLHQRYKDNIHLIVIDAHIDGSKPSSDVCKGAAASGLWFLLEQNPFCPEIDGFTASNITIVGHQSESKFEEGITAYQLSSVRIIVILAFFVQSYAKLEHLIRWHKSFDAKKGS